MKATAIYHSLRDDMIKGILPLGTRLPDENTLSQKFGVARKTLRATLSLLEEEGRIKRIRAHGTFVCQPKLKNEEKVISILIPFPDFITNDIFEDSSNYYFFRLFGGAALATAQKGWRIQALPFSRTNDPTDIDYESLECLQEDSRVIVPSLWYKNAFEMFLSRKIRVGLVTDEFSDDLPFAKITTNWIREITQIREMKQKAVTHLFKHEHCKRAVCLCECKEWTLPALSDSFSDICGTLGMFYAEKPLEGAPRSYAPQVATFCKENKADLLIIDSGEFPHPPKNMTYHQYFGLSDDVIIFNRSEEGSYRFNDYYFLTLEPFKAGFDIAHKLMKDSYKPHKFLLQGTLNTPY